MVRKLKHHEQKLLKKVDFTERNRRTSEVMHRYHIQRREDYTKYQMGIIHSTKSLAACQRVTVSSICRRRLPVVAVRLKLAETVKQAVKLVEQGHIRVGPQTVTDPAFLVTRRMEDFVTWVDASKMRRHVQKYNDKVCI
ncbi:uncharacterized protein MONBRDRAFT_21360 [Monosiga brevicollis MX1]|uniref:U3 small nucleolar ribonucleoprotein protein IMP3 n=1 Tax=Monosiga brevicollis TaxID=81824 RepID=A9UVZ1_MONBE|nr:uncharacterized protein MONBRDRAFT_21360 [Monosiga brevicollis MX1]EDQ90675.1 predicted protein [Monosiga brevicollis MX1]|eukprot:XP_001744726.1 hypothetical protein [Monosiga brevicollis MX1]